MKAQWNQTALLAWLIAEPHRDRDTVHEPFTPDTFNPYADKAKPDPEQQADPPRRDGAVPYDADLLKQIVERK